MSHVTLSLTPEDERQLLERARQTGQTLDQAALTIIRDTLRSNPNSTSTVVPTAIQSNFWPEEESIDTFLEWLRESREEGSDRVRDLEA